MHRSGLIQTGAGAKPADGPDRHHRRCQGSDGYEQIVFDVVGEVGERERGATNDEFAGRDYGRRWFGYAARATWRFFRGNVAWSVVGLIGAAAGIYLLTPVFLGSDRPDLVREEILLAIFAAVGSAILLTVGVFAWEFVNAPAAMEREADARAATRQQALEQDLAADRQAHADLRARIDASRLRIELIDKSGPLTAAATNDEVKARFIESEKQTLIEPLRQAKPASRSPWEIDIYGESRSQKRFLAEVGDYVSALDERWPAALANAAVDRAVADGRQTVPGRAYGEES